MSRFSVRDMLRLLAMAAVLLAWLVDHQRMVARVNQIHQVAKELEDQLRLKGFSVPNPWE